LALLDGRIKLSGFSVSNCRGDKYPMSYRTKWPTSGLNNEKKLSIVSALSRKKHKKIRTKVGPIPFIFFIILAIAVAALVIPFNLNLQDRENAHAVRQGHR
jgi:hypothetical protein